MIEYMVLIQMNLSEAVVAVLNLFRVPYLFQPQYVPSDLSKHQSNMPKNPHDFGLCILCTHSKLNSLKLNQNTVNEF